MILVKVSNKPSNIIIGNHICIGLGYTISKGTKINNDCIIGTKSLLRKEFDNTKCIIAGNPAQIVKQNINLDY
jgi:acetyltransferase-like isoleucine patch superfamily enzyme